MAYSLTTETLDALALHMDDAIREQVHDELAPCTPDAFLARYLELEPDHLKDLLKDFEVTEG